MEIVQLNHSTTIRQWQSAIKTTLQNLRFYTSAQDSKQHVQAAYCSLPLCLLPRVPCKAEVFRQPASSVLRQRTLVSQLCVSLQQQHLPPRLKKSVQCRCWSQHMALFDLWYQTCRLGHHIDRHQPRSQVIHYPRHWLRCLNETTQNKSIPKNYYIIYNINIYHNANCIK